MPISYNMELKNLRMQAVVDLLGPDAVIVVGTDSLAGNVGVLATLPMLTPAFNLADAVLTLNSPPRTAYASASGTAAKAELRTSGGFTIVSGLVVGSGPGSDFLINSVNIEFGQPVQCSAGVISHAP